MKKYLVYLISGIAVCLSFANAAYAETSMSEEGQYIFNSLAFYIGGVLVAFMAAGFCMLESGLVTTKSVSSIGAKNIGKFAICSIIFFLFGYNVAYGIPEGGFVDRSQYGVMHLVWAQDILIVRIGFFKQCSFVQQFQ